MDTLNKFPGLHPKTVIISERGAYALIYGSKLPSAREFRRWVFSEVLPSIRLTGSYMPLKANQFFMKSLDDLHSKAVGYVRRYYPWSYCTFSPRTWRKPKDQRYRIQSWRYGYRKGSPDIEIKELSIESESEGAWQNTLV